ncbi:acetate--CoA ligase family protein [Rhodococcus fascians]|nr:acetate--CoA ligase family protein [Rhodococcus fascians]MBY4238729.1 acetate--CoA ligase family protein [Rhodococcus fascians]MBY4254682.1 acetate--CoA ligase family protein [Rhodococcus fascians]MBY4270084.1 acetate--CoA ligase family protein [Rhodococcus fascians]
MSKGLRIVTGSEEAVHRLWNPESVAIIGASSREGALAWWPQRLLQQYEFSGRIVPVNPNRSEIGGLACVSAIGTIDEPVDVAVVTLDAKGTRAAVEEAAAAGVKAVVLPAQGFGEGTNGGKSAEAEMLEIASAAGMRIHGPNSDGLANFASGAVMSIQPLLGKGVDAGRVAVLTQSGATAGSLISRLGVEGIGVRLYASAGNEIDLGLADYISVALQDPGVEMILTFIEAVRRPRDFMAVAQLAAELGKPIVAIKVGRTAQAAASAAAHTGALAGEDRIYDALFDSLGIIRVDELSEVVAVAKMHLAPGAAPTQNIGVMSVSGGQAGVLADRAAGFELAVPTVSVTTAQTFEDLFPFGTALNPCDLTGDIAKRPELAGAAYAAFDDDPGIGCVVYARKELTGNVGPESATALAEEFSKRATSLAVYAMDGTVTEAEAQIYSDSGIPTFGSASELFTAVSRLDRFRRRVASGVSKPEVASTSTLFEGKRGALSDTDAKTLLTEYGISFPSEGIVTGPAGARSAASSIGFPVTMKIVSEKITHKTEIGGVILGVNDEDAAETAFELLMERGRSALSGGEPEGVLIQQQIVDGSEFIVGLVIDPSFGPFVLVGTGGIMAELLDDVALAPAPVTAERAQEMVTGLRGSALLDGFRGAEPADVDALVDTICAISRLGSEHAERITELDLNPVLVRPRGLGAIAVDALIVMEEPV